MTQLRTILVDDERLARRGLSMRLAALPEVEIVAECANGEEALAAISRLDPDLVFLDIEMPGMSGFELVSKLQGDRLPMIVFVTAHDEFAVQAFKVHAIDYVLKPLEEAHIVAAVERALEQQQRRQLDVEKSRLMNLVMKLTGENASAITAMSEQSEGWPDRLTIKDGAEIQRVPVADIQWVDAAGDYMCVHTREETHIMRVTMKELESQLNPALFLRIHRSTIVNSSRITSATPRGNGEYELLLDNGARLKASRSCRDRIKTVLGVSS